VRDKRPHAPAAQTKTLIGRKMSFWRQYCERPGAIAISQNASRVLQSHCRNPIFLQWANSFLLESLASIAQHRSVYMSVCVSVCLSACVAVSLCVVVSVFW